MNANTKTELVEVDKTEVGALALITMDPARYVAEVFRPFRSKLDTLKAEAALIHLKDDRIRDEPHKYVDISTVVGMAIAVQYRAAFRDDVRIAGEKARVERKAPILQIGKLLDSEYKALATDAAPFEAMFDDAIKAEEARKEAIKQAKIAEERARVEAIQRDIQSIRDIPASLALKPSAAVAAAIDTLRMEEVTAERFAEFMAAAQVAIDETDHALVQMHGAKVQAELVAAEAEAARLAEIARIEQEREVLARQRAENERIANEQATESRRLANERAAQELTAKQQREAAEANARAEREAQAKVAAETKRQLEAQQAEIAEQTRKLAEQQAAADARDAVALAAQQGAQRMADDHGPAILMNAEFDECVRLQALADQAIADAHAPEPTLETLVDDITDDIEPTDMEILDVLVETFGGTEAQMIERLICMDFVTLRSELA